MKILAIDPGTATTGFAIVEKNRENLRALDFGVISTPKNIKMEKRLCELAEDLRELIHFHKPKLCAIESLFFFKNQKTAMQVAQARGVALCVACEMGLKIEEFTPLQVKQAVCGYGKADKKQIQKMVAETGTTYRHIDTNNRPSFPTDYHQNPGEFLSTGPRFKRLFDKLFEQYTNEDEEIGLWKTTGRSSPFTKDFIAGDIRSEE